MKQLIYIELPYATFGIVAVDGLVTEAAPIASWTVDKKLDYVLNYYDNKDAIIKIKTEDEN